VQPRLNSWRGFGRSIEAMVVYLHYAQAIGLERLRAVLGEIFGLSISEGALSNILARAQPSLEAEAARITNAIRASRVVCSDETGARVAGRTWWEWVFVGGTGVLHLIRPTRGKAVPQEVFGEARPDVWVSDAFGAQRGDAERWQMCLAHLLGKDRSRIRTNPGVFPRLRSFTFNILKANQTDTLSQDR